MADKKKEKSSYSEGNKHKPNEKAHVSRYFPGKAPKWVEGKDDDSDCHYKRNDLTEFSVKNSVENDHVSISHITVEENDRRLKRIQEVKKDTEINNTRIDERLKRRREIYKSEILEENDVNRKKDIEMKDNKLQGSKDNLGEAIKEKDEDNYNKRQTLKQKLLQNKEKNINPKEIEEDLFEKEDLIIPDVCDQLDPDNDEDENSEEEKLLKPVFVSKDDRLTIKEKLQKELEEKANKEIEMKLKEQKKKETKKLVLSIIQKDLNGELDDKDAEDQEMPDDTDEPDNTTEYENWKIRELKRIKRNEEENLMKLKEKEEIERRRNLTDDQRKEENLRLGSDDTLRPFKSKYKFMQKFYKMGVFYQDQAQGNLDHIFNRDYNLPVG